MVIVIGLTHIQLRANGIDLRQNVLHTAEQHLNLSEASGKNDGAVCKFHKYFGYKCGLSWCAMFVKYCLVTNGVPTGMNALAVSIKKDKPAMNSKLGCPYWYPTGYGSGHTGFVYSWDEKKDTDKFTGLDGNYTDKVRFVQRSKKKHAIYISDPYPTINGEVVAVTNTKPEKDKPEEVPVIEAESQPEQEVLVIDTKPEAIVEVETNSSSYPWKTIIIIIVITLILKLYVAFQKEDGGS